MTSYVLSTNLGTQSRSCYYSYSGSAAPAMQEKLNYFAALKSAYDLLIDGGNTDVTLERIDEAQYAEAFELYNELMSKSPALSREVMLEIIRKETELPAVLLTAILIANPSAAKDAVIQKELDERYNPLTTYQRSLIDQGLSVLSSKENMEAAMTNIQSEYYQLLNYEYLRLAEDASVVDLQAARETLIGLDTDPHGLWFKTNWLAGQNRFAEAYTIGMEAVAGLRPKSDHQLDWNNYLNLLQSLIAWTANPDFSLSDAEQKNLVEQMDDGQPSTKSLILQTLIQYGNYDLEFDTSYPIDELGTRSLDRSKSEHTPNWLSLYPNPVDEYFAIRLYDAPTSSEAGYVITDMTGRSIINGRLNSNNLEIIVNSKDLKAGSYILCIWDKGHLIHTEKLIKQ
jgi:Secretion system C-terminal sorting domain